MINAVGCSAQEDPCCLMLGLGTHIKPEKILLGLLLNCCCYWYPVSHFCSHTWHKMAPILVGFWAQVTPLQISTRNTGGLWRTDTDDSLSLFAFGHIVSSFLSALRHKWLLSLPTVGHRWRLYTADFLSLSLVTFTVVSILVGFWETNGSHSLLLFDTGVSCCFGTWAMISPVLAGI